ncbi:MAG: hypothetical protein BWX59_02300 [Bacteroidetes bacterium ADurb.Bin028]|nr:MAG: hypothetical protein BWX59_02300 [Bacteroidetes bacterium ADurb.Bin028]
MDNLKESFVRRLSEILNFDILCYLISFVFLFLFLFDVSSTKCFIHPEVIDKYPKYLHHSTIKNEIGKIFDVNNGEACVKDSIYSGNLCKEDSIGISRTRNFNYFIDYLDAMFTKYVTIKYGMISHYFFSLLTVVFIFWGMRTSNHPISFSVLAASFILCLSPILSMNGILYRSGKIITVSLIALLYLFFEKSLKERRPSPLFSILFLGLSCLFILADEMAVAIIVICWLIFFFNTKKISATLTLPIVWYVFFRIFIEPFLAHYLNDVHIMMSGGYNDFSTFWKIDFEFMLKTFKAICANVFYSMGSANHMGSISSSVISIFLLGCLITTIRLKAKSEPLRYTKQTFYVLFIYSLIIVSWVLVTYLMALRHPYIIQPPSYGAGYYFMVLVILFYLLIVFLLNHIEYNKYIFLLILLSIGLGNYYNHRVTRQAMISSVMGAEWVITQKKIQKYIRRRSVNVNDSVYVLHKKYIDSYRKK